MPLFEISVNKLTVVEQTNFLAEKKLQNLVENNLQTIFNSRFVASEFVTHDPNGRIDTLALSEDNDPVIIEYKKAASSDLINQSLFYKSWLIKHKSDFVLAVQAKLGHQVKIEWSNVRVICIAPNYKKYDLYAVQMMNSNIELWSYRNYHDKLIYLEKVDLSAAGLEVDLTPSGKSTGIGTAGKKTPANKAIGLYTFDEHLKGKSQKIQDMAIALQEYILGLDTAIKEEPRKLYIAYKISQNIVSLEVQNQQIHIFLKLKYSEIIDPPSNLKDVSNIGHYGTGDTQLTVTTMDEVELAKPFIDMSYHKIGG